MIYFEVISIIIIMTHGMIMCLDEFYFHHKRKLPKWELAIFFTALIITQLGALLDPFYGKVLKRVGYCLFSFAYFPIAVFIFKNKKSKPMITD